MSTPASFRPMLAAPWEGTDPTGWLMSEKLDGLRAVWTGKELLSREGHAFRPPAWWLAGFPDMALDGELYGGPGTLAKVAGMFHRIAPIDAEWRAVKFHVFDVPTADASIVERLSRFCWKTIKDGMPAALEYVEHCECNGPSHLADFTGSILKDGGEGVILRHPTAPYVSGRSKNVLKVKLSEYLTQAFWLRSGVHVPLP